MLDVLRENLNYRNPLYPASIASSIILPSSVAGKGKFQ